MKKWFEKQEDEKFDLEIDDELLDETDVSHNQTIYFIAGKEDGDYTEIENPLLVPQESVDDIKMDSSLSEEQKQQLTDICREYEDVLTGVPGRTPVIEHCVVVNSEIPT